MNVLFITSTRIGDAVLSTGLLRRIVESSPGASLTVACGPLPAPLFQAVPGLERIVVLTKKRGSRHWLGLWRCAVPTRWDMVVDLRGSAIAWTLWARRRHVLRPARGAVHRVRHIAGLLGLENDPPAPLVWTDDETRREAAALVPPGAPVLGLGPTANWPGKEWPIERYVEAVGRLTGPGGAFEGARVAVFGAPDERARARPLIAALPAERCIDLVGALDLPTAHACLERCRFYIGNDSGLMHLAAAAGTPTLGLFGPSRDELYAPWGEHCAVVRTERSYDEIAGAADFDGKSTVSHMHDLSVDRVVAAAEALWRRRAAAAA